ncbi:AAA family ATPase [Rhodococcus hoagii]|nr:AAA family ATPase [Prescottella equi]NKZ84463.1 AAA family ATPase [Prescottella equi]NKZ84612.1 AAA family ATPase [Prescottella equi]NKZ84712.1 AAA family ATPase [Prescottella equi]
MSFAPTAEQSHIHDLFRTGGSLRVRAGAGTGKTSTLVQLGGILEEQQRVGLYIAFNSSIAKEAGSKLPGSVAARTAHSLAFNYIAKHPDHAPLIDKLNAGRVPFHITRERFNIRGAGFTGADGERRYLSAFVLGRHAAKTVDEFCKTADPQIAAKHVPRVTGIHRDGHMSVVDVVLPIARAMWADLLSPYGTGSTFTHSHYLKLWQLQYPIFGPEGAALFVDEAQDISPVLADVIENQKHLQVVCVGDSAQAIYRFTGATDFMSTFPAEHTGNLSRSWRFGDRIADAANHMLGALGDDLRLTGNPGLDSVVDRGAVDFDAILTRTNGAALAQVIKALQRGERVHLMADTQYASNFLDAAEKLMAGEKPSFADFAAFDTWEQVVEYAEEASDASDWKTLISLLEDHTVDDLRAAFGGTVSERDAELTICTAHKSKGREWDRVLLDDSLTESLTRAEDMLETEPSNRELAAKLRDEQMLSYVAITRAQQVLNPGRLLDANRNVSAAFTVGATNRMDRALALTR